MLKKLLRLLFLFFSFHSNYLLSATNDVEPLSSFNSDPVEGVVLDDMPQEIEELKERFLGIDQSLHAIKKQLQEASFDRVILSVGITGAGKSPLQNFLVGKNLISEKTHSGYALTSNDTVPFPLGRGESITRVPSCYVHEKNAFIDLPGFIDNHGAGANAAVSYALFKIFKSFMSGTFDVPVKVLLYMPEDMIMDDRGITFSPFINTIAHIFEDNLEGLVGACNLVVTKQNGRMMDGGLMYMQPNDIADSLTMKQNTLKNLTLVGKELTDRFSKKATHSGFIHSFKTPVNSGHVDYTPLVEGILSECKTATKFLGTPKMFVTDEVRVHLGALDKIISASAIKALHDSVHELFMENMKSADDTKAVREYFVQWRNNLRTLFQNSEHQTLIDDFEQFFTKLKALCAPHASHFAEFESKLDIVAFVYNANNKFWSSLNQWESGIKNIFRAAEQLTLLPQVQRNDTQVLIKGSLIGLDEVAQLIQPNTKVLHVLAERTLLINQDIIRQTMHQPFVLLFSSPVWKIVGKRLIDLRGVDAENYKGIPAEGVNGIPGKPGLTGGSFYGFGKKSIGLPNLTINVSSGKGGQGQQGGAGKTGEDAKPCYTSSWPSNPSVGTYHVHGNQGTKGGNGTLGGKGGFGGKAGILQIEGFEKTEFPTLITEDGANGTDGAGGLGGKGGKNYNCASCYYNAATTSTIFTQKQQKL